jgi:hypothetical protein
MFLHCETQKQISRNNISHAMSLSLEGEFMFLKSDPCIPYKIGWRTIGHYVKAGGIMQKVAF